MKIIREVLCDRETIAKLKWEYNPKDRAIRMIMDHLVDVAAQHERDFWNEVAVLAGFPDLMTSQVAGVELKVSWVTDKILVMQKEATIEDETL